MTLEEADLDWGDADVAAITGRTVEQAAAKQRPRTRTAVPLGCICACTAPAFWSIPASGKQQPELALIAAGNSAGDLMSARYCAAIALQALRSLSHRSRALLQRRRRSRRR